MQPNLSDDVYRFIWDGSLITQGHNPYTVLPESLMESDKPLKDELDKELYQKLNSKKYYTVYPPLNQFIFGFCSLISGNNQFLNTIMLRIFVLGVEILLLFIIHKIMYTEGFNKKQFVLYALNPLMIVELTGNLHFEGIMLCFFFISWYFIYYKDQWKTGAFFYALSISTKLLTLIFLPFFIKRTKPSNLITFYTIIAVVTTLTFLPFLNKQLINNIGSSIALYFQTFEFNASIYYLIREIGYWVKGYNIIETAGKVLSIITFLCIVILAIIDKGKRSVEFFKITCFAVCIYYFLSTTLHPWYLATPLLLSAFTRYKFVLVWSILSPLSYWAYHTTPYTENLYLVGIEYGIVFLVLILELCDKIPIDNTIFEKRIIKK
ncbi:MAG: mannosyltransferase [Flavobacteriales bacterium]